MIEEDVIIGGEIERHKIPDDRSRSYNPNNITRRKRIEYEVSCGRFQMKCPVIGGNLDVE